MGQKASSSNISKNPQISKSYDLRIKDKKLAIGEVSKQDWDAYLNALPDDSERMMTIEQYEENLKNSAEM